MDSPSKIWLEMGWGNSPKTPLKLTWGLKSCTQYLEERGTEPEPNGLYITPFLVEISYSYTNLIFWVEIFYSKYEVWSKVNVLMDDPFQELVQLWKLVFSYNQLGLESDMSETICLQWNDFKDNVRTAFEIYWLFLPKVMDMCCMLMFFTVNVKVARECPRADSWREFLCLRAS